MPIAKSRLTARGQVSVPVEVRRMLGIGPGSVIEWTEKSGAVVVRRAVRFTSDDIHKTLFPEGTATPRKAGSGRGAASVREGIREYIRRRHARG